MSATNFSLPECYEHCRRVQKAYSGTYHLSTLLFPREVRPHVYALYAFTRKADEIVDNPAGADFSQQLAALEGFEAETMEALSGGETPDPVLRAFSDTVWRCGIEASLISAFLESMKMDTRVFRYQNYEELREYMYGSAEVVGVFMCRIAGVKEQAAEPHARALGEAMQLTNFLRDVKEDLGRDRIYLPLEDLEHFGYTVDDLSNGVVDKRLASLMQFEIERARDLYAFAEEGIHYIPGRNRYPVAVAARLYEAILDEIEANGYDVFSQKAATSTSKKLRIAASRAL